MGLLLTVGLAGCSSRVVGIRTYGRPEVSLPLAVRRVAVFDFETTAPVGASMQVDGRDAASLLARRLAAGGYFHVVDPAQVDKALKGLAKVADVRADPATRKRAGRRLKVDALALGTVRVTAPAAPTSSGDGSKEVTVNVDFTIADVETEHVLLARRLSRVAREKDGRNVAADLTRKVVDKFAGQISPPAITVERYLLAGKSPACREGYAKAGEGDWQGARQFWQQAVRLKQDDFYALNDLGVWSERAGRPEDALKFYETAVKFAPGQVQIQANLHDLRTRVLER